MLSMSGPLKKVFPLASHLRITIRQLGSGAGTLVEGGRDRNRR